MSTEDIEKGVKIAPKYNMTAFFPNIASQTIGMKSKGFATCSICGKCFAPASLARHKRTHLGIRPFECIVCKKSFSQKCHVVTHVVNVHKPESSADSYIMRVHGRGVGSDSVISDPTH